MKETICTMVVINLTTHLNNLRNLKTLSSGPHLRLLFIQQVIFEHLLCTRHCSRHRIQLWWKQVKTLKFMELMFQVRNYRDGTIHVYICYRWNVCVPPRLICEILGPKVMVLGGGAMGKWLGHESRTLVDGFNAFIRGQKTVFTRTPSCWHSDFRLPGSRTVKINFCCLWDTHTTAQTD